MSTEMHLVHHWLSQRSLRDSFWVSIRTMSPMQKVGIAGTSLAFLATFLVERFFLRRYDNSISEVRTEDDAHVTLSIFGNFFQVARLALPTWRSREFFGSTIFISLFMLKALMRVWLSKANGDVLAAMIHGARAARLYRFIHCVLTRMALGLGSAMVSGAIEGIRPWLIGCYRERLSRTFQRRLYDHLVFYQASVLDNRLEAADTAIATYCGEFSEHFAELPYYFVLPGLECITSMSALIQQAGLQSALLMSSVTTAAVLLLRHFSPQFGRIHCVLLSREDDYRRLLTNGLSNVENIAMHNAGSYTRKRLDASLAKLKSSLDHMALAKGIFEMMEVSLASFLTFMAQIVTFISSRNSHYRRSINDIYMEIQLIEDLNVSVKDFVVNFRELSHLTEFSTKMAEFDRTLASIAAGTFIRDTVEGEEGVEPGTPLTYTSIRVVSHPAGAAIFPLFSIKGVVLKSPAGQELFSNLNVDFQSDEDWVLIGENGCGKTSLLRMLCGLWPASSGTVLRDQSVRYLLAPQHSYMAPQCTLYEQISFPDKTVAVTPQIRQAIEKAVTLAGAETVVRVIGGYESRVMGLQLRDTDESYDWSSLSGGQKQRISMARVFFHVLLMDRSVETPVAILDEATSMMDDTEQDVLNHLRRMQVRMISVTHRDVVIRHHTNVLKMKRGGVWTAEKVRNPVRIGERVEAVDQTI